MLLLHNLKTVFTTVVNVRLGLGAPRRFALETLDANPHGFNLELYKPQASNARRGLSQLLISEVATAFASALRNKALFPHYRCPRKGGRLLLSSCATSKSSQEVPEIQHFQCRSDSLTSPTQL